MSSLQVIRHAARPYTLLLRSPRPLLRVSTYHSSAILRQLETEQQRHSPSSFPPPSSPSSSSARKQPPPPPPPPLTSTSTTATATTRVLRRKITSVDQLPKTFGRNQIIAVPENVKAELEDVLRDFKAPIRYAFAYGSGVFRQSGYSNEDKPLLDFIFAVSHPSHWHAVNMQQHPDHYSMPMRLMGSDAVAWMQDKGLGANVWFNVEVTVRGKLIKYGVISIDALCRDLLDWETLYISGRTQKPVRILTDDARVRLANQVNLASALRTALLLLPEEFNEVQLFEEIAGLSYRGDFRMKVGENPLKVRNIVHGQVDEFRSLYGGLLKSFWKSVYVIGEVPGPSGRGVRLMRQDRSVQQRAVIASKLPIGLKGKIRAFYERKFNLTSALEKGAGGGDETISHKLEEIALWERIVQDDEFLVVMDKMISQIVGRPTFNQSLKGILSAGPLKSLRYIIPKLRKKWAGDQPRVLEPGSKKSTD